MIFRYNIPNHCVTFLSFFFFFGVKSWVNDWVVCTHIRIHIRDSTCKYFEIYGNCFNFILISCPVWIGCTLQMKVWLFFTFFERYFQQKFDPSVTIFCYVTTRVRFSGFLQIFNEWSVVMQLKSYRCKIKVYVEFLYTCSYITLKEISLIKNDCLQDTGDTQDPPLT